MTTRVGVNSPSPRGAEAILEPRPYAKDILLIVALESLKKAIGAEECHSNSYKHPLCTRALALYCAVNGYAEPGYRSEPRRSPAGLFVDLPCLLPEGCGQYDLCAASLSYMPHVCRTTSPFVWRTRTSRQKVLCFDGFISNRIGLSCDVGPTR